MPRRPPLTVRLLVAPLLLVVAGCTSEPAEPAPTPGATGPVDVPVQTGLSPDVQAACAALSAALPVEVDPGVRRRPVTGDQQVTAAWGDPPVTLECGVPEPDRPDQPAIVNGVEWSVRDIGAGFRWTTVDRTVNIAVTIPDAYPNGAEIIIPLVEPVEAALPPVPSPTPSPTATPVPSPEPVPTP